MLHKFRRFFVLTLCLALVSCLSVTAFAQSRFSAFEDYDGGDTWVEASCSISAYMTTGVLYMETAIAAPQTTTSVSCRYLDNNLETQYASDNGAGLYESSASVIFTENNIYHLVDAFYDFWAEVPTSYGWQEFELNSIHIEYEIQ